MLDAFYQAVLLRSFWVVTPSFHVFTALSSLHAPRTSWVLCQPLLLQTQFPRLPSSLLTHAWSGSNKATGSITALCLPASLAAGVVMWHSSGQWGKSRSHWVGIPVCLLRRLDPGEWKPDPKNDEGRVACPSLCLTRVPVMWHKRPLLG